MGGKPLAKCYVLVVFPIGSWDREKWSKEKVRAWLVNAGAKLQNEFVENVTTHVVVDEKAWKNQIRVVQEARAAKEDGQKVHIVSPDWLENALSGQKKVPVSTYLWEKLDKARGASKGKGKGKAKQKQKQFSENEDEEDSEAPRGHTALLGEILEESTNTFLSERDIRILEAERAGEEKVRREREEAEERKKELERKALEQKSKERAAEMKRTRNKGRGKEFSENHHVWTDTKGFPYDIMLTKVDTLSNSNERLNITMQIFESNSKPHTYSTNLHFAGTNKRRRNNILAAIGSNLSTALRVFRQSFREQTGVTWDDRIKAYNERIRARERKDEAPGIPSSRSGKYGGIKSRSRAADDKIPFEERSFEYMPPLHTARGLLPDGKDEVPEIVKQRHAKSKSGHENVEQWMMSGANGLGPDSKEPSPLGAEQPAHIDLTEDEPLIKSKQPTVEECDEDEDVMMSSPVAADAGHGDTANEEMSGGENVFDDGATKALSTDELLAEITGSFRQEEGIDFSGLSSEQPDFNFSQPDPNAVTFDFDQPTEPNPAFSAPSNESEDPTAEHLDHEGCAQGSQAAGTACETAPSSDPEIKEEAPALETHDDAVSRNGASSGGMTDGIQSAQKNPLLESAKLYLEGFESDLPNELSYNTQPGQTQLAAKVGEDLLELGHAKEDEAAGDDAIEVNNEVLFRPHSPGMEEDEGLGQETVSPLGVPTEDTTSQLGERKRDETSDEFEVAAKRFQSEDVADSDV